MPTLNYAETNLRYFPSRPNFTTTGRLSSMKNGYEENVVLLDYSETKLVARLLSENPTGSTLQGYEKKLWPELSEKLIAAGYEIHAFHIFTDPENVPDISYKVGPTVRLVIEANIATKAEDDEFGLPF